MDKASPYISMSVSQTKKGLLTQEINKESSKKIYKKWTSSTFDLSGFTNQIFRLIFLFLIFIRFLAKQSLNQMNAVSSLLRRPLLASPP